MDKEFFQELVRRLLLEYGAALSPPVAVYNRSSKEELEDKAVFIKKRVSEDPRLCFTLLQKMLCSSEEKQKTAEKNRLSAMSIIKLLEPAQQQAILTKDVLTALENTGWDKTIAEMKKGWEKRNCRELTGDQSNS